MVRLVALVLTGLLALAGVFSFPGNAGAQKTNIQDIRNTKHNLSASGPGTIKAATESQICVFCHTPHAAEQIPKAPLWNRKLSGASYTNTYKSSSIEADAALMTEVPGGTSKLCLSCHDGTMALGNVNVLNGKANQTITFAGGVTSMPAGTAAATGFTRNLGVDLTNDHPISFTYDGTLATNDGELRAPGAAGVVVGNRTAGAARPKLPLDNGQVQCTTCHDPHVRETDATKAPGKFLRLNRLQVATPGSGAFSETGDIICIACHDKAGNAWAYSAHANPNVATQTFLPGPAGVREFPANLPVWRASCLSCHDTHTVQGARRLLREGTSSTNDVVGQPKPGGASAIEETCYQCHSGSESILSNVSTVPNIKSEFGLAVRMPIRSSDTVAGSEVHDIGTGTGSQRGKDFVESPEKLGKGNAANRHVECTDCHNPHRVTKKRLFNASAATADAAGTHNHGPGHTNIASGVLRGTTGVEPSYSSAEFGTLATFELKKGDPGATGTDAVSNTYVTREYQVCLKCHSSYAYDTPPLLASSKNGTPSPTNGMTRFTDQAMEFQAPHPGTTGRTNFGPFKGLRPGCATTNASECGTGACVCLGTERSYEGNNWRSWHPVMAATGRTTALRGTSTSMFKWPWRDHIGTQTMYCSDCHGASTVAGTVDPNCASAPSDTTQAPNPACGENVRPWGPHGSENNFLLKGTWDQNTTMTSTNALCVKCHNPTSSTRFNDGGDRGNLHSYHQEKIGKIRCTWCHIAVPHGWKNRSFLVNLNDVGPEVGLPKGTQVRNGSAWKNTGYTNGPYYLNAMLKIRSFPSGIWTEGNCGSAGTPGNGQTGRDWMRDSSESCNSPP
jgi:hypothetical protein